MVNAPPTPPPTSATELQDEAREKPSSGPSTSTPVPQPTPEVKQDLFQHRFPTIADLAGKGKFYDLIQAAEETDLSAPGERQSTRLLVIAPLVLAYLIVDDAPPARHALIRLPENLLSNPLIRILLDLSLCTLNRQHAKVYAQAEALFDQVTQTSFLDKDLANVIASMVTAFVDSFRERTFNLLSKAYVSLPLSLASTYLGLPVEQIIAATEKSNWTYDTSTEVLSPTNVLPTPATNSVMFSSLLTFNAVADSVAQLEF
ncbi:COP9 signalosome [Crucibulum laeve]|uniref:COP9 signalosome n=1 Tax=Crucibulum laeve TaxID=68775 RepID=A0A5C3MB39_9AGAR|nr:COP9 signalosome [Crucibulum laeve]